jgi:uncharacterized protein YjbJ (UPF0337 family)
MSTPDGSVESCMDLNDEMKGKPKKIKGKISEGAGAN